MRLRHRTRPGRAAARRTPPCRGSASDGGAVGRALTAGAVGVCLVVVGVYVLGEAPVGQAQVGRALGVETYTATLPASDAGGSDAEHATTAGAAPAAVPLLLPPVRVSFPGAGVDASVVPVGTLPSGMLQVPDDPLQVGWWAPGALPGAHAGSTVLAGHMTPTGEGSAMSTLIELQPGEAVQIADGAGTVLDYRVTARDTAPRSALDRSLFTTGGRHRLVLITCGGPVDPATGHYADNVVVIAEPVR